MHFRCKRVTKISEGFVKIVAVASYFRAYIKLRIARAVSCRTGSTRATASSVAS
jgi:hypothetical protein